MEYNCARTAEDFRMIIHTIIERMEDVGELEEIFETLLAYGI